MANVKPYLDNLGTCIQEFNQDKAWTSLPASEKGKYPRSPGKNPSAGFCKGASIDWLRRVLLRFAKLEPAKKQPPPDAAVKADLEAFQQRMNEIRKLPNGDQKQCRVKRMADTWAVATEAESQAYETSIRKIEADYKRKIVDLGGKVTEYPDGRFDIAYPRDKEPEVKKAKEIREGLKKQLRSYLDEKGKRLPGAWKDVSAKLDAQYPKKTRKFGQLTILASRGKTFKGYKDFKRFVSESLYLKVFEAETGLLLTFTLDKRASANDAWKHDGDAHSIAVHYQGPCIWAMFDPNVGVYTFNDRAKLVRAVLALIDIGYRDDTSQPSVLQPGGESLVFADEGYAGRKKDAVKKKWEEDCKTAACEAAMVEYAITDYEDDYKRFEEARKEAERKKKEEEEREQRRLDQEAETMVRNAKKAFDAMNNLVVERDSRGNATAVKDDDVDEYNKKKGIFMREKNKAVIAWDAARLKRNRSIPDALKDARKIWDQFDSNKYNIT
jgi:hypothetical protein